MVFDISKITGITPYSTKAEKTRTIYYRDAHAFLIVNKHTIELRCDPKLSDFLIQKYESIMRSRYFGNNGIEIVLTTQLSTEDLSDLVRLSYHLTS